MNGERKVTSSGAALALGLTTHQVLYALRRSGLEIEITPSGIHLFNPADIERLRAYVASGAVKLKNPSI